MWSPCVEQDQSVLNEIKSITYREWQSPRARRRTPRHQIGWWTLSLSGSLVPSTWMAVFLHWPSRRPRLLWRGQSQRSWGSSCPPPRCFDRQDHGGSPPIPQGTPAIMSGIDFFVLPFFSSILFMLYWKAVIKQNKALRSTKLAKMYSRSEDYKVKYFRGWLSKSFLRDYISNGYVETNHSRGSLKGKWEETVRLNVSQVGVDTGRWQSHHWHLVLQQ